MAERGMAGRDGHLPLIAPDPAQLSGAERAVAAVVRVGARVPGLRRMLLSPVVARPGYWFATGCAWLWGRVLFGRFAAGGGIHYFSGLPRWAYGRGGTTVGAIYLTTDNTGVDVLQHEAVHKAQWKKYGLAFIALYIAAGSSALTNRFEVEAGLEKGGYLRPPRRRAQAVETQAVETQAFERTRAADSPDTQP